MGKKVIGSLLGLGMMVFAVMAYLSNEPASKTDQGHIVLLVVFVMGLFTLVSNLSSKQTKQTQPLPPVIPVVPVMPVNLTCPNCHKSITDDYAVCPYCATVLKPKCPNCGKEVAPDFKNCPYCAAQLTTRA